jgi:hypothetical protein
MKNLNNQYKLILLGMILWILAVVLGCFGFNSTAILLIILGGVLTYLNM